MLKRSRCVVCEFVLGCLGLGEHSAEIMGVESLSLWQTLCGDCARPSVLVVAHWLVSVNARAAVSVNPLWRSCASKRCC